MQADPDGSLARAMSDDYANRPKYGDQERTQVREFINFRAEEGGVVPPWRSFNAGSMLSANSMIGEVDMALTLAEAERLTLLIEECGEVIQAATKILRHGYDSYHPTGTYDNREQLHREMGDLQAVATLMDVNGDIVPDQIERFSDQKLLRLPQWLHQRHKFPDDGLPF